MMAGTEVFQITPTTQQYDWGKLGDSSKVAQFASASRIPGFSYREDTPYAELWMGTHVTSPSRVSLTGELLSDYLKANPSLIGDKIIRAFDVNDGSLPFLFKVLSIEKALSIQTHPDKKTAKKLHEERPDIYKDANHKPEMAIAVTPFTALCGFLPVARIAEYLRSTPEFAVLIPTIAHDNFLARAASSGSAAQILPEVKDSLKELFSALMKAEKSVFTVQLDTLVARYRRGGAKDAEYPIADLVLRLSNQFPGDIGVFCPFVLNYVELRPGEAIFLGAGEPHAYVTGDIMECMATSDNVIRAGLTPKLRDIPNLIAGLTYEPSEPTKHVVKASAFQQSKSTLLFNPPVPEFSVLQVEVGENGVENHRAIDGPSIAIVTEGGGSVKWGERELDLSVGTVIFIGAGTEVKFRAEKGLVVYRAFVE